MDKPLLTIANLCVGVHGEEGYRELLKGLSLEVNDLEIVALVGGSGSGKTMTGLSILRLLPLGISKQNGEIIFKGENLFSYSKRRMRLLRGKEVSMIFQEPLSSFNPVFTIGSHIEEVLQYHLRLSRRQRQQRIWQLLDMVGIPDPERVSHCYPHQLSGGLRQRAMIAQAIAAHPQLMIADEPTSNLDVTLQALIIGLFKELKNELKMSMLLITHDLGVVKELADRVAVLFDGRVVEFGKTQDIMNHPKHPFTCELVRAISD